MKIFDNIITVEENNLLYQNLVYRRNYFYGETDEAGLPPTGLVFNMNTNDELFIKLYELTIKLNNEVKNLTLQRAYVNLFLPNERPFFHTDGNVITNLFYINPPISYDEGGETQFIINNEVINVLSKPCRMVSFDGTIMHRATSFRSIPRITVALKFNK